MITFTTDDLIAAIKRVAHVPEAQETLDSSDFLALADMAMRTHISPKIAGVREGYWTTYKDYELTNSLGPQEFAIPGLALGSALVEVKLLVSENYLPVDRIEINELIASTFTPRPNYGYYVEDNLLKFLPNGGVNGTLRVWYNRMPSQLDSVLDCAQITAITDNEVSVGTVPDTFTTDSELDIVSQTPGFNVSLKDTAPTSIVGTELTFPSLPAQVKVGDYICLSGHSCVVQCPIEWKEVLVQSTVCKIYESQGYLEKLKAAKASLEEIEKNVLSLISPRQIQKGKFIQAGGPVLGVRNVGWPYPIGRLR